MIQAIETGNYNHNMSLRMIFEIFDAMDLDVNIIITGREQEARDDGETD